MLRNSLSRLASDLVAKGPHKQEHTVRRVRTLFNHVMIADTTQARHVWEHPNFPQFYLPLDVVTGGQGKGKDKVKIERGQKVDDAGSACLATLNVDDRSTNRVIVFDKGDLAGLIRLEFGAMG